MQTVTTWRDQEDEPYTKVINEAFPEPNTQYPHRPDYVGPSNLGKAGRAIEGDVVTAGLAYGASKAINPLLKIIGPAGALDAGINILTGESDTAFEKKLDIFKPAKVIAKSGRILKDTLTDVFDRRVTKEDYADLYATAGWSKTALPDDIRTIYNLEDISTPLSSGKRIFPWENPSGMTLKEAPSQRGASRDFAKKYNLAGNTSGDIDLSNYNFQGNPEDYKNFELLMQKILQDDDIRVKDIPYFAKQAKTPIVGTRTEGTRGENLTTVREIYNDYLVGYFNRWIRTGVEDNFQNAARLITPNGQVVGGQANLLREMKLYTIAPDSYRPDPFKSTSKPYKDQLADLIEEFQVTDKLPFEKAMRAHHVQMIDEGWPLFRNLPSEQIPVMRELLEKQKLFSGNHPENLLVILDKYHKRLHNTYWPKFKPEWNLDELYKIPTAAGRAKYVEEYANAVKSTINQISKDLNKVADYRFDKKYSKGKPLSERRMRTLMKGIEILNE